MLNTVDLSLSLTKDEYQRDQVKYQVALHLLGYQVYVQQRPVIILFEGWDAAGKGGAIKRVTKSWTRVATSSTRSQPPRGKTLPATTCTASGGDCPKPARSPSSTAAGMAG